MEWYYNLADERLGPITAVELLTLKDKGDVSDLSLVWTEGVSNWMPFHIVRTKIMADALDLNSNLVECAFSGKLIARDEALEYGDKYILPEHKDRFVQQLGEGGIPQKGIPASEYGLELTFTSVLKRSWDIYRKYFILLALINITVWLPLDQLSAWMDETFFAGLDEFKGIKKAANFETLLNSMFGIIATAAFFSVCISHSGVEKPTYASAMKTGLSLWGKIWATRFIQGFFFFVGILVCMLPLIFLGAAMTDSASMPFIVGAVVIFLVIPGLLWFFSRIALTLPYLCETGVWGMDAIKKSFFLTKGRVWKIIGYFILVGLIVVIPMMIPIILTVFPPLDSVIPTGLFATVSRITGSFLIVFTFSLYKQIRISIGEDGVNS